MPYTFDAIQAFDPTDPLRVASDAEVTFFAPDDPTQTPIEITDVTGIALPNPYLTNDLGSIPKFVANIERVAWASGEMGDFLTSWEGLRDAAEASRVAAEEAAAGAVDAVEVELTEYRSAVEGSATAATAAAVSAAEAAGLVGVPAGEAVRAAISDGGAAAGALAATINEGVGKRGKGGLDIWPSFTTGTTMNDETYAGFIAGIDDALGGRADKSMIGTGSGGESIHAYTAGRFGAPEVLLMSGVHGHERNNKHAAFRFFERFTKATDSSMRELIQRVRIVWIPALNPSGWNATRHNSNGVDLNRNGDMYWGPLNVPQSEIDSGRGTKGSAPLSEPESQALKYILDNSRASCIIDAHMWNNSGEHIKTYTSSGGGLGNRRIAHSFLERWGREYNYLSELTVARPTTNMDPMLASWASHYVYRQKQRYSASSVILEIRDDMGGATPTSTPREFMRAYCGLIHSYIMDWLEFGQVSEPIPPITWYAYRTQDHSKPAVSMREGGNLIDRIDNHPFQYNVSQTLFEFSSRRKWLDVPVPLPGKLYVTSTAVLQSKAGTNAAHQITHFISGAIATSAGQDVSNNIEGQSFATVQVPANGGQTTVTQSAVIHVDTVTSPIIYRLGLILRKADDADAHTVVRAARLNVTFQPEYQPDLVPAIAWTAPA